MIFDECHRSQFGDMHVAITKAFKKYYIFGFTGTLIFARNAGAGKIANLRTTAQAFGGEPDENGLPTRPLHTYTIIDAIRDKNVLQFKVDYISTIKAVAGGTERQKNRLCLTSSQPSSISTTISLTSNSAG